MKLEVGMYVRTKKGIFQIRNKDVFIEDKKQYIGVNGRYTCIDIETIEKASHNIIDLLGISDLIKVSNIGYEDMIFEVTMRIGGNNPLGIFADGKFYDLKDLDIKSIVTKEQIESMSYRVGSDK